MAGAQSKFPGVRRHPNPRTRRDQSTATRRSDERATLKGNLAQLDAWDTERRASRARLSQLDHLAHQATKNLSNTTTEDQRRVYELLDLHIDVSTQRTYEISGTIPTHGPLTEESLGEVSTQALQHPRPLQRGCT